MVTEFHTFSVQHFGMLFLLTGIAMVLIRKGRKSSLLQNRNIAIVIAGITFSCEIIETIVLLALGRYDYHIDLPLFLCDISALILPFVLYNRNRKWLGILYFWTLAGTLQALLTPELKEGFPSLEYFRYFTMHGGIVIAILFSMIMFSIRITWRDLINAVLYAQVYLVCIHLFNQMLDSNYGYTIQKPAGPTVLDYFGPWPWYILAGEGLMIVLFLLLWLPFLLSKRVRTTQDEQIFESD